MNNCPKNCPKRTTGKNRIDCHNDSCDIWRKHIEKVNKIRKSYIHDRIYYNLLVKRKGIY